MAKEQAIRFGRYRLDHSGLWRGKQEVRLTPKALAVLRLLVSHPGEVVTKQQFFEAIWPDTVVSDAALTSCIQELRLALGDDARRPKYLVTLHRRGYRFEAVSLEDRTVPSPPLDGLAATRSLTLVGRESQLQELREACTRAHQGQRQIVFIAGEAGIGKTTLVEAFLADRDTVGAARIGRGQCVEHYGAGEAYLPILEALGRLCREPKGGHVVETLARYGPTWLVQMPSLIGAAELRSVQRRAQAATRERMLRELTEAVEVLAADEMFALRIEDLHWSDVSTLDWLSFLARRPDPARLLVIGTYRPVEVLTRDHPLGTVKQELQLHRQCREVALPRLDEAAVGQYLHQRCPSDATQAQAFRRLAQAVYVRTEGNPLFMVNAVDDLVARRVLVESDAGWLLSRSLDAVRVTVPSDIRQMIERQLTRLSPIERQILEAAGVVGAEFSGAAVAAAADATTAATEQCCTQLAGREQFIRAIGTERWPDGTITARYAFLHALYREVLYENISAGRRAELHRRVGARLETAYGARSGDIAAWLALHFECSGDIDRAVRYLAQAGTNAVGRNAPREAVMHLEHALELLEHLPDTSARTQRELSMQIALGSQLMTVKGWAAPEAERAYARAQALCEQVSDAPELFPSRWGLWVYSWGRGDVLSARRIAEDLLTRAERTKETSIRLEAHHAMWATLLAQGEFAAACDHAVRGFALYDSEVHAALASVYGNHDAGACSRMFRSWALGLLGFPERALESAQDALALAERLGHPFTRAWAEFWIAAMHQRRQEPHAARIRAEAAGVLAREHDFGLITGWASAVRGWAIAADGKPQDGIAELKEGIVASQATGSQQFQSYFRALLAEACLMAGHVSEGMMAVDEGLGMVARGERFYEAELWRLRGELLLRGEGQRSAPASDVSPGGSPEVSFVKAKDIAHRQGAMWLELRSAISLIRLRRQSGDAEAARRTLVDLVARFTEGFETTDLREARGLLES